MKSGFKEIFSFRNLPIFWKIASLPILAVGLTMIGVFAYVLPLTKEKYMDDKKANASSMVGIAFTIISEYDRRVVLGELTLEQAQERAKARISSIRFGADENGYIWINNLEGRMLMHPVYPELNGENLLEFEDAHGKFFFREMVELGKGRGEGYVEYVWPKSPGAEPSPKISFVRLYRPWGWVIGSGIYVDDVMIMVWKITIGIVALLAIVAAIMTAATF
ncbi:MAG TPA: cache domain-containing protein, partial [Dissulfurispiraceae bacterium]|nr:cache domain-containing protein [Dissulfurispiraceae bacterium]